ncbi:MAG: response regulator [Chloroflexota bacterium]
MKNEKILIVDDEPFILDICRRLLSKRYTVHVARNGLDAIALLQQQSFDLVLSDIKMPGLGGLELIHEIKDTQPEIACITMTGFSSLDTAIKAIRSGVNEFVVKPFEPNDLIEAVERVLEKERLRKENIRLRSLLPLFEFNKSLMSTVDISRLLEQVLSQAANEVPSDYAGLCLLDAQGNIAVSQALASTDIDQKKFEAYAPQLIRIMQTKHTQLVLDNPFNQGPTEALPVSSTETLLQQLGMFSVIITPLSGKAGLLGVMITARKTTNFEQSETSFLSVLVGQVTIAYENARLFEDLQQAYDELKTLDHAKNEFINIAAHELRTPLAILTGYAGILSEDISDETQQGYLSILNRNAMRLRGLIEDLLNMRYINTGELELSVSEVDLQQLVTQLLQDVSVLATEKQIRIQTKITEPLPHIYTDQQKVELTLTNLLANAIKFTPKQGEIWIDGRALHDGVEIAIRDTGIGISQSQVNKIFDSFYQVEASLNRRYEGIGLGLSISKGIIEYCGGTISVESQEGQGSRFIITLPFTVPQSTVG